MSPASSSPNGSSSVVVNPSHTGGFDSASSLILPFIANAADAVTPWGASINARDIQLRAFWPTEPVFASALYTTISRYVSFGWTLEGPPRTTHIAQEILNGSEHGRGWKAFLVPLLIDLYTQDNGAWFEKVRLADDPLSPVVQLNHLDSNRMHRTGNRETPAVYRDLHGKLHLLKWYQVEDITEMPSPIEAARGAQVCTLSRVLRTAQIMRDIQILKHEKASGRFARAIHLIGGVQNSVLSDALRVTTTQADSQGLTRYMQPIIAAALDPTARVSHELIEMATLPDAYSEEESMKWYLTLVAMAFGIDYQDLAPLPGGGLGSSSQSKVLNMKSRGKGAALFMSIIESVFNFHGIFPSTVKFKYGEVDIAEQMEKTALRKERAIERETRIRSGEITTEVARQMAVDDGDLDERYLIMMREHDTTDLVVAHSTQPIDNPTENDVEKGEPGPPTPRPNAKRQPAPVQNENSTTIKRPPNSNDKRNRAPSQNQKVNP